MIHKGCLITKISIPCCEIPVAANNRGSRFQNLSEPIYRSRDFEHVQTTAWLLG